MIDAYSCYSECSLCPRGCRVDRIANTGVCGCLNKPRIARAALHFWEEPVISGEHGSGAIFFSGCSLGCIYCQNKDISSAYVGREVSARELSEIMLRLEAEGAHNINLVTAAHFAPHVAESIALARERGLGVPVVYNSSGYESIDTLRMLEGSIDIYLPDLKYYTARSASLYSMAKDYPRVSRAAIAEMVRQCPEPIVESGIMRSGVIVRLLLLPGHVAEAKLNLKHLYENYGDSVYISLMSQYTPIDDLPPPLNRRVTDSEYCELVDYASHLGVSNAFVQERESATKDYIPSFDGTGVTE